MMRPLGFLRSISLVPEAGDGTCVVPGAYFNFLALAADPHLKLECNGAGYPAGWVLLEGELDTLLPSEPLPQIVVTSSADTVTHHLRPPRDGRLSAVVELPRDVLQIRLLPNVPDGLFRCAAWRATPVSSQGARLRNTMRGIARRLRAPNAVPYVPWRAFGVAFKGALRQALNYLCLTDVEIDYQEWTSRFDTLSEIDKLAIRARVAAIRAPVKFSIVVRASDYPGVGLPSLLAALRAQFYPLWELVIWQHAEDSRLAEEIVRALSADERVRLFRQPERAGTSIEPLLRNMRGDFVLFLPASLALREHTLYLAANVAKDNQNIIAIYGDDDQISSTGARSVPRFKPDWDEDLLLGSDYIGDGVFYRIDELCRMRAQLDPFATGAGIRLRRALLTSRQQDEVRHVPHVIFHLGADGRSVNSAVSEAEHGDSRTLRSGRQDSSGPTLQQSLVSVLIPTRDRVELLRQCVDGVLHSTSHTALELIIVDNRSTDAAALEYLRALEADPRARVLSYPAPFNFSALNNYAAQHATGDILCLLNNDVVVFEPSWLSFLVAQVQRREVGIAGALLLYPDNSIQHGGVVLGLGGVAGHVHVGAIAADSGHLDRLRVPHQRSAVTAACLCVRRDVYMSVGGLDEELSVAFNDVDFCLRVRRQGLRVILDPRARLYHYESQSRGSDQLVAHRQRFAAEVQFMQSRWGEILNHDPFHNPNLGLEAGGANFACPPREIPPWRKPWV